MHVFIVCLLLGLGAAAPLGPVNFEIIRRNLHNGFISSVSFGLGACLVDLTYLILLSLGVLVFLSQPKLLAIIGIIGSLVIAWFGIQVLRSHAKFTDQPTAKKAWFNHLRDGYLMTFFNPYTILFWASVSTQIANLSNSHHRLVFGGVGVLLGTFGWVVSLNTLLTYSKRLMSQTIMQWISKIGGILLILIAVYGLIHSLLSI